MGARVLGRLSVFVNLTCVCALAVSAALFCVVNSQAQDLSRPQPLKSLSNPSAPALPDLPVITLDGPAKAPQAASFDTISRGAEAGNPLDQGELGHMYAVGDGVPQDFGAALKWLKASAGHNYPDAEFYIGQIYFNGDGVDQDYAEALKWFVKAGQQGNRDVQYLVSIMYAEGLGTAADPVEAAKWLRLSAVQGNSGAQKELARLRSNETLPQVDGPVNGLMPVKPSEMPMTRTPSTNIDDRIKSAMKQVFKGAANQ